MKSDDERKLGACFGKACTLSLSGWWVVSEYATAGAEHAESRGPRRELMRTSHAYANDAVRVVRSYTSGLDSRSDGRGGARCMQSEPYNKLTVIASGRCGRAPLGGSLW